MRKLSLIACAVTAIVVATTGSASAVLIKTQPNLPAPKAAAPKIAVPKICKNSISKTIVVNGIAYTAKKCR